MMDDGFEQAAGLGGRRVPRARRHTAAAGAASAAAASPAPGSSNTCTLSANVTPRFRSSSDFIPALAMRLLVCEGLPGSRQLRSSRGTARRGRWLRLAGGGAHL
eukprot:GHVU01060858.1.p2 GENE.GHVU01060858.1~~GHVU01060858.1.p2  ORF type:complete len:104 (-),score=15.22 GHVU01060858.1:61-372(-)